MNAWVIQFLNAIFETLMIRKKSKFLKLQIFHRQLYPIRRARYPLHFIFFKALLYIRLSGNNCFEILFYLNGHSSNEIQVRFEFFDRFFEVSASLSQSEGRVSDESKLFLSHSVLLPVQLIHSMAPRRVCIRKRNSKKRQLQNKKNRMIKTKYICEWLKNKERHFGSKLNIVERRSIY